MKLYTSILAEFHSAPLAILPAKLEEIRSLLYARAAGHEAPPERVAEVVASRRPDASRVVGRVGIIPVFGAMTQRANLLSKSSGGISTEDIGSSLDAMIADRGVRSVCMVFDSPGGSVYGVQELADKLRAATSQKKVVGVVDSMCASAAYWVASQCSELNITPGGQCGSIGVMTAHTDLSKAYEAGGIKTTYVTSAPHKVEGAPEMPLSEEALAEMQAKVDHYHGLFVKAVARGRATTEYRVSSDFGGGRMLTSKAAVAAGMADHAATLEQVLQRMGAGIASASMSAAMMDREIMAMAIAEMEAM